jgi:hypothetical protein
MLSKNIVRDRAENQARSRDKKPSPKSQKKQQNLIKALSEI